MADTEVGRLVVKLTGDGTGYQKMMTEANTATSKVTADIEKKWDKKFADINKTFDKLDKDLDRADQRLQKRGDQIVESLFPREKYERQMNELALLFSKGIITQDVVTRGVQKYTNELFKDDIKLIESNLRHNEREQEKINRYREGILRHNNREQEKIEAYNRREQERIYSQRMRDQEKLLARARAISEAADPNLLFARKTAEINNLVSRGLISKSTRDTAIMRLKQDLAEAGKESQRLNSHLGQGMTVLRSMSSAAGVGGLGGLNAAFGRLGVVAAIAYVSVKSVRTVVEELFYNLNKQLDRTRETSDRLVSKLVSVKSSFGAGGLSQSTGISRQDELKSATRWADIYASALAKATKELDKADTFIARNVAFSKEAYRLEFAKQQVEDYKKLSIAREENLEKLREEIKLSEDARSRQMTSDVMERSATLLRDTSTAGERYIQTLKKIKEIENKIALDVGEQGMDNRQVEGFKKLRERAVKTFQKESKFPEFFGNIGKMFEKAMDAVAKDRERMKERGQKIREDLFPLEAYNAKVKELNELFAKGFIDQATRQSGIAKAQEELDKLQQQTQKDYTIHFGFKSRGGVESGTQEAQALVDDYRDSLRKMYEDAEKQPKMKINPIIPQTFQAPQLNAGAGAGNQPKDITQIVPLMQQLVGIAQQQLEKVGVTLSPAGFDE